MKKIVRRTVLWQCGVCKTAYDSKKAAQECESREIEERIFKKGNLVRNIEPRECGKTHAEYQFRGRVIRVIGPQPPDYEYEVKWLGGRGINLHVFQYEVKFRCPSCQKIKTAFYYTPELIRVRKAD